MAVGEWTGLSVYGAVGLGEVRQSRKGVVGPGLLVRGSSWQLWNVLVRGVAVCHGSRVGAWHGRVRTVADRSFMVWQSGIVPARIGILWRGQEGLGSHGSDRVVTVGCGLSPYGPERQSRIGIDRFALARCGLVWIGSQGLSRKVWPGPIRQG